MRLRSMLIVPGDQPAQMAEALKAGADALILDLEESVAPAGKADARRAVSDFLGAHPGKSLWVRINRLDGPDADRDIAAIIARRPDGIVLPGSEGGRSVAELARRLTDRGNVGAMILPIATTASAMFQLGTYGGVKRLAGLSWSAEDLGASVGALSVRDEDGGYAAPFEVARSLCLFGAAAAGVPAIDASFPAAGDPDGLKSHAERARGDGFSGMIAVHPDQVPIINETFSE